MVKTLHRALAPVHCLADLDIRHVFDEFQYQQMLAFRRQVAYQLQKCLSILTLYQGHFGRLAFVVERRRIVELERENRELRRANEILKSAAIFFGAELDRRSTK